MFEHLSQWFHDITLCTCVAAAIGTRLNVRLQSLKDDRPSP